MLAGNQLVDMVQVQCNFCGSTSSGIVRVGRVVRPPWAAEPKGRKNGQQINILNKKYLCKKSKLSRKIKGNTINACDLIKWVILVRVDIVISCMGYQKT
jgi:hypothetical protein